MNTTTQAFAGLAQPVDREFFERELAGFVPPRVFDAHCHLWREADVSFRVPEYQGDVGVDEYLRLMSDLHPERRMGALFLSFASPDNPDGRDRMNQFVAAQTARSDDFRGEFFVRPDDDPEWVRQEVRRLGLQGLDNLYCDTSANCEPIAHQAILRILGPKKLMYGSDLPVSHMRGRSLSAADSFLWIYRDSPVWGEKHLSVNPVLIGLEHLRSLKWACWSEHLDDTAIEDIFWNNAAQLLGVR